MKNLIFTTLFIALTGCSGTGTSFLENSSLPPDISSNPLSKIELNRLYRSSICQNIGGRSFYSYLKKISDSDFLLERDLFENPDCIANGAANEIIQTSKIHFRIASFSGTNQFTLSGQLISSEIMVLDQTYAEQVDAATPPMCGFNDWQNNLNIYRNVLGTFCEPSSSGTSTSHSLQILGSQIIVFDSITYE